MTKHETLEEKRNYCAGLVGRSALDDIIRGVLIENIPGFEEGVLDSLIESLEREQVELKKLSEALKEADRPVDEAWQAVEKKQEEAIRSATDKFVADLVRDKIGSVQE